MGKHISWLEAEEKEVERSILGEYSSDEVNKHLAYLATLTRAAGSDDELKAARYIKGRLDEYGIEGNICEVDDAYISYPGRAELYVSSPAKTSFNCLAHAFAASTPPEGIEAELISLGKGFEKDYQGVDARGKIVLVEPGGASAQVRAAEVAEENGVAAHIHISTGSPRAISINRFGRTWGNPNKDTINKVPQTPAISICSDDGKYLVELIGKGPVVVSLKAAVWRGYKKIRFPMGTIPGTKEPEKYVLFATHYCGWYTGVTDNATANAMMLEMARIFSKYRQHLGRSVKLAWWSGHSQGRAACSTWYLENFWDDLRDNAVAYIVTDSIGRMGTSGFSTRNTEEIRKFHERVVKDTLGLGEKSNRITKTGDQSFWGLGIPSLAGATRAATGGDIHRGGMNALGQPQQVAWYSHTVEDTMDKVDMELIQIPFKVIATSILRLCNSPVLPFDFVAVAKVFKAALKDLQSNGKATLELASLITQAENLENKTSVLNKIIEKNISSYQKQSPDKEIERAFKKTNACLMELSRILIPILSTEAGKYGQDLWGTKYEPIPKLQPLKKLNFMDGNSDEYRTLRTSLVIERNMVSDALDSANRALANLLTDYQPK